MNKSNISKIKLFLDKYASIIIVIMALLVLISNIILLFRKVPDYGHLNAEIEKTRSEAEKYKNDAEALRSEVQSLNEFKTNWERENKAYREKLQNSDSDFDPMMDEFSRFLDRYSAYNSKFADKNEAYFKALSGWHLKLTDYENLLVQKEKAVDRALMSWKVEPYLSLSYSDKWTFGGGVDLRIPITHKFSILAGAGYSGKFFVKAGVSFGLN